jgi:cysteinyl-tRNA synthetase
MANVWMHNGHLQVEGEKMSKSLGNFVTIRELVTTDKFGGRAWPGDVVRLAMLKTQYREPIDWRAEGLEEARKELLAWTELIVDRFPSGTDHVPAEIRNAEAAAALADDMNTPLFVTSLHRMFQAAKDSDEVAFSFAATLKAIGFRNVDKPGYLHPHFMGNIFESGPQVDLETQRQALLFRTRTANGQISEASSLRAELESRGFELRISDAGVLTLSNDTGAEFEDRVKEKIRARNAARAAKNWAEADGLRDELLDKFGVVLKDNKDGTTTWEVKR